MRNLLSYIPTGFKIGAVALTLGLTAIAAPVLGGMDARAQSNPNVEIESNIGVANVTAGDTSYGDSVNAKVDEVVKVQVWYHNREDFDSGKIAKNLRMGIDIPEEQGKTQTISSTVSGDNTNTVNDSAQVNLSLENAHLDYIEGSAKWRYNKQGKNGVERCLQEDQNDKTVPNDCYVTEGIGDEVVTNESGLVLEDAKPCFAFEATVTVLARVKASEVKVNKFVSQADEDTDPSNNDWKLKNKAKPGDELEYMIRFENKGNTVLEDVVVGDNLPDYVKYQEGSTLIYNGNNPDGIEAGNDNVYQGGIRVGDYNPGASGYVVFTVKVNPMTAFEKCGTYTLKNVGVVRPEGMNEFYNTTHTDVKVECEEKAAQFVCEDLSASPTSGQAPLEVTFTATADVSEDVDVQSYLWDFDNDGDTDFESSSNTTTHTYEEVGTHEASVRIRTSEGITDKTSDCVVKIEVKEKPDQPEENGDVRGDQDKPDQLAVTGPAETAAGFLGFGGLGIAIRGWLVSRRRLLEQLLS